MFLIYEDGGGGHCTCKQNVIARVVQTQVSSRGKKQAPALHSLSKRPLAPVNKVLLSLRILYGSTSPRNRHVHLLR